jgi:hypothetical protein
VRATAEYLKHAIDCRILGPVVAAIPFKELDDDLVRAANDSVYGLAAGVWSRDISKAHMLAGKLKAGTVWINCYNIFDAALPFGGYKQSGWGREMGQTPLISTPRRRLSAPPCDIVAIQSSDPNKPVPPSTQPGRLRNLVFDVAHVESAGRGLQWRARCRLAQASTKGNRLNVSMLPK